VSAPVNRRNKAGQPTDFLGNVIGRTDVVVWPVRRGSSMWLVTGVVEVVYLDYLLRQNVAPWALRADVVMARPTKRSDEQQPLGRLQRVRIDHLVKVV